jgi:hypothetical protein
MPAKCLQNACKMPATEATNTNKPISVEMPKKAEASTTISSAGANLNCHFFLGRHDIQHNGLNCDTQHNDPWHNH